jgi:predicted enzyme related to lactoylglutathione lyase
MELAHTRIATSRIPHPAACFRQVTGVSPGGIDDDVESPLQESTLPLSSLRSLEGFCANASMPASNRSASAVFRVRDVDAERRRPEATVQERVRGPATQPWGARSPRFRDPDGNPIGFFAPRDRAAG